MNCQDNETQTTFVLYLVCLVHSTYQLLGEAIHWHSLSTIDMMILSGTSPHDDVTVLFQLLEVVLNPNP